MRLVFDVNCESKIKIMTRRKFYLLAVLLFGFIGWIYVTDNKSDAVQINETPSMDSVVNEATSNDEEKKRFEAEEKKRLKCIEDAKALHKELCDLHQELESFRKTKDFISYGFGRGGEYYVWFEKVGGLKNDKRNMCCLRNYSCVAGDLEMLGMEYVSTSGSDNEYTKTSSALFKPQN